MAAVVEKPAKRWTYEEYAQLNDDQRYEIISASSVRRDRYEKKDLYARFGVKEYWIGDPANKSLEVLSLKGGRYQLHCSAEEKGKLTSLLLPGLEFDLAEVL